MNLSIQKFTIVNFCSLAQINQNKNSNFLQQGEFMFWERFYKLCEENKKKPLQIVNQLNIAAGSITKWKNGAIPSGSNLCLIADYFNVSVDYLLGRTTIKENEYEDFDFIYGIYEGILKEKNGDLKLKILFMKLGMNEKNAENATYIIKHLKTNQEPIKIENVEITDEDWKEEEYNNEHPEIRLNRIKKLEEELEKLENEDKQ